MTNEELEILLNEEEGNALDFKRDQYAFQGANSNAKSELLKDILAFANSWRRNTAYILIGVDEVKGGRSKVVGVKDHLDDADLQQFVNSKTQRPVDFSYIPFPVAGTEIGIIEIPLQERPIYINKDFGKLKKDSTYIRRGSSTVIATPDEIARMVEASIKLKSVPQLVLDWADSEKRIVLPSPLTIHSLVLEPRLRTRAELANDPSSGYSILKSINVDPLTNQNFSQECIDYTYEKKFFKPLGGLRLHNNSEVVGERVCFVGSISKPESDGVEFRDSELIKPSQYPSIEPLSGRSPYSQEPLFDVKKNDGKWVIKISFVENARPQEEIWMLTPLLVGSKVSKTIKIEGKILADNLPTPIRSDLEIRFDVEQRPMEEMDHHQIWE